MLAAGASDNDIERWVRRHEWAPVHRGVFVDHTAPPTWDQRAWAAVLAFAPAALSGESALRAHGVRAAQGRERGRAQLDATPVRVPIEICVDETRSLLAVPGVRLERVTGFEGWAMMHLSPPRTRVEHALLKVGSRLDEAGAVALLGDACQQGHSTPARLVAALDRLPRLRHRRLLRAILADVALGAYSVLERAYLTQVERGHGLPGGSRQRRVVQGASVAFRDVEYLRWRTVVELDGRLGHETATDRWADLERDLAAAAQRTMTLRVGWGQTLEPCRLAETIGRVLRARGWRGSIHPCARGCSPAPIIVGFPASGAGNPTVSGRGPG